MNEGMPEEKTAETMSMPVTAEQSEHWTKRGYEGIKKLEGVPGSLLREMKASLDTPQFNPNHQEGLRMAAHIGLMSECIEEIAAGRLDFKTLTGFGDDDAERTKDIVTRAIHKSEADMAKYAYLHDIKKPDCMSLKYTDGGEKDFTMSEWEAIVEEGRNDDEGVIELLRDRKIAKIGYRQDSEITGGEPKEHGKEAFDYLMARAKEDPEIKKFVDDNELIIKGVGLHEIHFQVFNNASSARQFFSYLIENPEGGAPKFTGEEIDFIFAACFIDIASSRTADFSGFLHMMEARRNYETILALREEKEKLGKPLTENEFNFLMKAEGPSALEAQIKEMEIKRKNLEELSPDKLNAVLFKLDELLVRTKIPADKKEEIEAMIKGENPIKDLGTKGYGRLAGEIKKLIR